MTQHLRIDPKRLFTNLKRRWEFINQDCADAAECSLNSVKKYLKLDNTEDRRKHNRRPPRVTSAIKKSIGQYIKNHVEDTVSKKDVHKFLMEEHNVRITRRHTKRVLKGLSDVGEAKPEIIPDMKPETKAERIAFCFEHGEDDLKDRWFGDELRLGLQGVFPTESRFYSKEKFADRPPVLTREKT
eukprot:8555491-Prorocentrum_lima.AAC.1